MRLTGDASLGSLRDRVLLTVLYSAGIRLGEVWPPSRGRHRLASHALARPSGQRTQRPFRATLSHSAWGDAVKNAYELDGTSAQKRQELLKRKLGVFKKFRKSGAFDWLVRRNRDLEHASRR